MLLLVGWWCIEGKCYMLGFCEDVLFDGLLVVWLSVNGEFGIVVRLFVGYYLILYWWFF